MNKPIRIELKALRGEIADNTVRAVASTCGNPDRAGCVIMPGAFTKASLQYAVNDGWLDVSHEWELPIGFITEAKMQGDELHMEAQFHDTEDAQRVRQVVKERIEAKRSVSVSIGFMPDYATVKFFPSGDELLKWAKDEAFDMARLETKAIKALGWCYAVPQVKEVFEFSICPVGMNPKAKVTEAKNLTAQNQFDEALDAFVSAIERDADIAVLRGRISDPQKARLLQAVTTLEGVFKSEAAPDAVVPDPDQDDAAEREARIKTKMRRASLLAA